MAQQLLETEESEDWWEEERIKWEEREKGGDPAVEAEQTVGGEGEALSVEGDNGKSQVEGADIV